MKKSTFIQILVIGLILFMATALQFAHAQDGVGINVPNPLEMLDVDGAIKIGTDFNNTNAAPAGGAGTIRWNGTNYEGWDGTQWIQFGGSGTSNILEDADQDTKVQVEESADEDKIRFDAQGLEVMVIEKNGTEGMVGVGTSDPRSEIHISDGSASAKTVNDQFGYGASLTITDNAIPRVYFEAQGQAANKKLMDVSYLNQVLSIGSLNDAGNAWDKQYILSAHRDGNVGIGTGNAQDKLHVTGSIRMVDGNQAAGYVPVSNANGTMIWSSPSSIIGVNQLVDADNDTKIQVEESADEDLIRFDVAGTEYFRMEAGRVRVTNTNWNVFYGDDAGELTGTGERNTAFGTGVLRSLTNGAYNTAIGDRPLLNLTSGSYNVGMGSRTMNEKVSGDHNIALGRDVMWYNTTGSKNIAIGSYALTANNGDQNIAIGFDAGYNNTGSGNVFLGTSAGRNSSGSNKLYIANTNTNSPLIYGEFDNGLLRVNGTLNVNSAYSFPTADGTNGYVMTTNGSGAVSWVDPNTLVSDGDWTISGNDQYSAVSGNVGIGTNTPDAKFQVVGTAIFGANGQTVTGTHATIGSGINNEVAANYAFVAGIENTITSGGVYSAIFGRESTVSAGATFIGGSDKGSVGSTNSAIVGGFRDTITTGSSNSVIAGGEKNSISANRSFIGGGSDNTVSGPYSAAFGESNTITGGRSLVAGNHNTVSNIYSVAFGQNNSVGGQKSLVGGQYSDMAQGNNSHSFVWGLRDSLSGNQSAIVGGENNTIAAEEAFIGGGYSNEITSKGGFIGAGNSNSVVGINGAAFGQNNTAPSFGEFVIGTNATEYVAVSASSFNSADRVFVVGNGNNTSSRSNALTVYKNGTVNINDAYNLPTADGTNGYVMTTDGSGAVSWTNPNTISTADDGDWTINGNDQYSAVSGNVGIGSTVPTELLHLRKDGSDNYIRVDAASTSSGYAGIRLAEPTYDYGWFMRFNAASAGGLHFAFNDNTPATYDRMTILPSGNVGIGTTAPSSALYVVPTTASGPTVTIETGSNQYPSSLVINPSTHPTSERATVRIDDWGILQDRTGTGLKDFAIYQNSTASQRFNIDVNGNVGIGDETPDVKLDVAGQIQMETGAVAGYIPVSDANGTMTWTDPTTVTTADDGDWTISGNDQYSAVSGNVGIGTTTPMNKLSLGTAVGSSTTDVAGKKLAVYNNAAGTDFYGLGVSTNTLQFHAQSTAAEDPDMVLLANGNVGMGVVAPQHKLQLANSGIQSGFSVDLGTTGSSIIYKDYGASTNDLHFVFEDQTSTQTEVMTLVGVGNTGYVGIGTSTPDRQLNIESATGPQMLFTRNDNNTTDGEVMGEILFDNNDDTTPSTVDAAAVIRSTASGAQGNSNKGGNLIFLTKNNAGYAANATERMRIAANGNVGIGAASPQDELHVAGSIRMVDGNQAAGYIPVSDANGTMVWTDPATVSTASVDAIIDADGDTKIQVEETADEDQIRFDTGGNERMIIRSNGLVGIGTTNPQVELHINDATNDNAWLQFTQASTGSASGDGLVIGVNSSENAVINNKEATNLELYTNGTQRMVIDAAGDVGIGGASSGEPLHITNSGGIQLTNSEISNTTDANGVLFFDENYYNTGEAGDGHFNGNGGGLAIKNQDGWGALVSTANMQWLDMDLNSLHVGGTSSPGNNNLIVDGNIGVGTGVPVYDISLGGNTNRTIRVEETTVDDGRELRIMMAVNSYSLLVPPLETEESIHDRRSCSKPPRNWEAVVLRPRIQLRKCELMPMDTWE